MAGPTLTLNAPGKIGAAYTFPDGFDIRGDGYASRLEGASVDGRRGRIMRSFGARGDVASVMISGRLKEATLAALRTALDDLAEAVGDDAVLWLQYDADGTASYKRERPVRLANLAISPAAGGFIGVSLTFAAEDTWRDVGNTPKTTTATVATADAQPWSILVDYAGSASQPGRVKLTASGGTWPSAGSGAINWRGPNMVYNSSLEEDDGTGFPKGWVALNGSPVWEKTFGYSGHHCVKTTGPGTDRLGTHSDYYIPVNGSTWYYATWKYYAPAGATDFEFWVRYRDSGKSIITGASYTSNWLLGPNAEWRDGGFLTLSPSDARYAELISRHSGAPVPATDYAYITDVQFEEGTSNSPYHSTNDARYKHRTVSLSSTLHTDGVYMVDCASGEVTLSNGSTMVPVNAIWDGGVFDLLPGRNHIDLPLPPNTTELIVEFMHPNRYLV